MGELVHGEVEAQRPARLAADHLPRVAVGCEGRGAVPRGRALVHVRHRVVEEVHQLHLRLLLGVPSMLDLENNNNDNDLLYLFTAPPPS